MSKKISIVMPSHNNRGQLELALESLCNQTFPTSEFEVFVIDQVSNDGSRAYVKSCTSPYKLYLIEQDGLFGISVSRNAGFNAANSPIVLMLDADHIADENLLASHFECHKNFPGSIVCGRALPHSPAYKSFIDLSANPESGLDRGTDTRPIPCYQTFGYQVSMPSSVYEEVGPYDVEWKRFQDIEYACRAETKGVPIIYCGKALSYHNHTRTLDQRIELALHNRMVPKLFNRYPFLRGEVVNFRSYEPISLKDDPRSVFKAKFRARFYSLWIIRKLFYSGLKFLNRIEKFPRVTSVLYWRIILGYSYVGYRNGLRKNPLNG